MSRVPRLRTTASRILAFAAVAVVGGGCDLQTKAWAERSLLDVPGQSMTLLEPWLELSLAYNTGTAFSLVPDLGDARWLFGVFALAAIGFLAFLVARGRPSLLEVLALGTIAGGALGNGIDRLFHASPFGGTAVVDFIRINYPWGGSWPTFNVADVLVVVGVALLLLGGLRRSRPPEGAGPEPYLA